jgi:uncharacterized caspase-like protein
MNTFATTTCVSLAVVMGAVAVGCDGRSDPATGLAAIEATSGNCWSEPPVETDGRRQLALIVGVGEYKADAIPDLSGPPNDARKFYGVLTGESYGFPKANTCLLLDADASRAAFERAFDGLIERARAEDTAVVYFAGHGSQAKDKDGDEPDEYDETLILHDARTGGVHDFRDDELNALLGRLGARTQNVLVVLDSCNSGTATRGDSGLVARFFTPEPSDDVPGAQGGTGDGGAGYAAADLPGLVTLTAASDGTPAFEKNGAGIFTDALIRVLTRGGAQTPTYAQLARQVPPLVAAASYQVPYFQGDLQRTVFARREAPRPTAWDVIAASSPLELSGPPLPGMGVGAELRIFDGAATAAETADPVESLATVVITRHSGVNAEARIAARSPAARAPEAGDIAVLIRPADEFLKLAVRLRAQGEAGGIAAARAQALRRSIEQHPAASTSVDVVDRGGEFELSTDSAGKLVLRGPENGIRNRIESDAAVPETLWLHARQRALLQLRGEGGEHFVDNQTLQVRLVPSRRQPPCARGDWTQAAPGEEQVVPLCHRWNLQVRLSERAPMPLLVGALILSTDGSVYGLPRDQRTVLLRPGESATFDAPGETFQGALPLDTQDQVLVFGTQERNPVSWNVLSQPAPARGAGTGGLGAALDKYLRPGSRGSAPASDTQDETAWTLSALTTRVEANARFLDSSGGGERAVSAREYTIAAFDVRPYLPDDPSSALHKVLRKAHWLATASRTDSFGYRQHPWSASTDEANLRTGIDCSRAIWFAFTRAGIPYNRDARYLATAEMVQAQSRMADQFDRCPVDGDLQLGDVLVYRSDERGDGHVVMVIDPLKRIAWGSHGWDGSPRDAPLPIEPDTGVEYQRIKFKQDWRRWDRGDMQLKACWRHRQFARERERGIGVPGVAAIAPACDATACRT